MDVNLQQEWANVSGSPLAFLGTVVLSWIVIWLIQRHFHRTRIENLESRLKLRDDEIARLERSACAPTASAPVASEIETAPPANVDRKAINRSRPTPAEPSGPQAVAQSSPRDEKRVFLGESITPGFLMGLCAEKTAIHGQRSTSVYIGKWMRLEGLVNNISDHGYRLFVSVRVPITRAGTESDTLVWLSFTGDRDQLEIMQKGDKIVAVGQIKAIKELEIDLTDCELVHGAGFLAPAL